jgi:hypothetical protein
MYVKTKNAETFRTSADSTIATVIESTLTGAVVELIGLTTAMWGLLTNGTSVISQGRHDVTFSAWLRYEGAAGRFYNEEEGEV